MKICGAILATLLFSVPSLAGTAGKINDGAALEKKARKQMSQLISKLGQSAEMKQARFSQSMPNGQVSELDGNSYGAISAFHKRAVNTCMEWLGYDNCGRWLAMGMTAHGESSNNEEKSSNEDQQAKIAKSAGSETPQAAGNGQVLYQNYVIDAKNPNRILDEKRKLDLDNIRNMSLIEPAKQAAEDVGYKAATRQAELVMNESAEKGGSKVLLADDPLRDAAEHFTRMLYDHSVASYNAALASQEGVEAVIDVSTSDCAKYFAEVKKGEAGPGEQRLPDQDVLRPLTMGNGLDKREELCNQLMATSLNTYGAKVNGDKVEETGVNGDRFDAALYRAQAMVILNGGIDPNSIPMPEGTKLTPEQVMARRGQAALGGLQVAEVKETNNQTLTNWNQSLINAAQASEEAAKYAGGRGAGKTKAILEENLVNPNGGVNLVQNNGMTPMQREYIGSDYTSGDIVFAQDATTLKTTTTTEINTITELESVRLNQ